MAITAPKDLKRKLMDRRGYHVEDADTLECPICISLLAPPIYQCENGHLICSECCKKVKVKGCPSCSKPVGHLRNRAVEKILESAQVVCENASYGCKFMLKLHPRGGHECMFQPIVCPVPECLHKASTHTLPSHMTEKHQVRTIDSTGALRIKMGPSNLFVIMRTEKKELFLLHRQGEYVGGRLGYTFFCTSFEAHSRCYDLVVTNSLNSRVQCMRRVPAYNIRDWVENHWNGDFIFIPKNKVRGDRTHDVVLEVLNSFSDSECSDPGQDTDFSD